MLKKMSIVTLVLLISACGGSGSTPTNPDTVFQLFAASKFIPGTINTTNYTGTDNIGGIYTGTFSEQTQNQSTFLGEAAIPVLGQLQLNNTANGASVSAIITTFFSVSSSDRRLLGTSSATSTTVSSTTTAVPYTAKIGDFGVIGTYIDNAGDVNTQSYRIDDGGNGNGKAVSLSIVRDQFGQVITSSTSSSIIDINGNTLSKSIVVFFADLGATITLNSN